MSRLIGVNTLVFLEELQEGTKKQWEYFGALRELGFPFVEVRREFFRDWAEELIETKEQAEREGLVLYYSVPDVLFVSSQVNEKLSHYLQEAMALGASQLKLTLGEFEKFHPATIEELQHTLTSYPTIKLTIENDQSIAGGKAERLSLFIAEAHQHDLPIALTFDTGNVLYVDEDPEEAAKILQDFVNYIHIKNVHIVSEGKFELAYYETGDIELKPVLQAFKENVPAAIEYPCGNSTEAMEVLKQQLALVKQA